MSGSKKFKIYTLQFSFVCFQIHPSHGCCYISFSGGEVSYKYYEVLCSVVGWMHRSIFLHLPSSFNNEIYISFFICVIKVIKNWKFDLFCNDNFKYTYFIFRNHLFLTLLITVDFHCSSKKQNYLNFHSLKRHL